MYGFLLCQIFIKIANAEQVILVIWRETEDSGTCLALRWLYTRGSDGGSVVGGSKHMPVNYHVPLLWYTAEFLPIEHK